MGNRALSEAGFKPASIEASSELDKAEARVTAALKYALRKGKTLSELEDAARVPREACAERLREYQSALLGDKEAFGATWPLQERSLRSFDEDLALARGGR